MKKVLIVAVTVLISSSAFAETVSQKFVRQMVAVLQSKQVSALLTAEDGPGRIEGIKYIGMETVQAVELINYQINFRSYSGPVPQTCVVIAKVSFADDQMVDLGAATCVENGGSKK